MSKSQTLHNTSKSKANPFHLPKGADLLALRAQEKDTLKEEREHLRSLTLSEKTMLHMARTRKQRFYDGDDDDDDDVAYGDGNGGVGDGSGSFGGASLGNTHKLPETNKALEDLTLQTRNRHLEREALADYIKKKRELFLVQYALGVKNEEIRRLEESALEEEAKLTRAEHTLETDAAKFEAFLKENDRTSVEAMRQAEAQTKIKLEKQVEIKKLQTDMMTAKSSISKYEDHLKELSLYRDFIYSLSPPEWVEQKRMQAEARIAARLRNSYGSGSLSAAAAAMSRQTSRKHESSQLSQPSQPLIGSATSRTSNPALRFPITVQQTESMVNFNSSSPHSKTTNAETSHGTPVHNNNNNNNNTTPPILDDALCGDGDDGNNNNEQDGEMYFVDPQQILHLFAELEEHNLSLIQNGQETEEQLQDLTERVHDEKIKLTGDLTSLKSNVDELVASIEEMEERARRFKMHHDFFLSANADEQQNELDRLNSKVEEVYRSSIGENEASINSLQMLTNVENRLEELFEKIEKMPPEKVEEAEKSKEKQRRQRAREEKLEEQRKHQEERVRRALERAKAEPKKQTGKKLMFRSAPPKKEISRTIRKGSVSSFDASEEQRYFWGQD